MKTVTAREANQGFSEILSQVERGEEIVITKHGRPVAVISAYHPPTMTPERKAAIDRVRRLWKKKVRWGIPFRTFTRDEMHER